MSRDLRFELFPSKDTVKPIIMHRYNFSSIKMENSFKLIRSAVRRLRNYNNKIGIFEDGNKIYSTDKIYNIPNADFTIEYECSVELPVIENKKIYCQLIEYIIKQNLSEVIIKGENKKYSCRNSITSKWIMTDKGFIPVENKDIVLERDYKIWVDILDDCKAYLWLSTGSIFTSKISIYDYMKKGESPIGMEVKNIWANNNQKGIVVEVCDFTVIDKLDGRFSNSSLKEYYISNNQGYRVKDIPDDTKVVKMKFDSGEIYPYYPQALIPILTREIVAKKDLNFSLKIEPYIKRNMKTRLKLDEDFINDIGVLKALNNLEFDNKTISAESIGYRKWNVNLPELICGSNKTIDCKDKFKVFNHGFYRTPNKTLKIGYIYPENMKEEIKAVANTIYLFAKKGIYNGKKDKYILENLIDIQKGKNVFKEEYKLGDITDYKRAANKLLQNAGDIDIVIALVPNGKDDDNPYNPFKTIWNKSNIPSQMISVKTAELFKNGEYSGNTIRYYLQNIVLGILGKTGGIPWVVKDMPGDIDCFVGIDVATVEKGIHYPACSVVFDKCGQLLSFYKPTTPQKGEKIGAKILQDIFDNVILSYEEHFSKMPDNIVIHRDGFSNEDNEWYRNYFDSKGIKYNIVEVRKNTNRKLIFIDENNNVCNPEMGYCVYNDKKAYLVTTDITENKGSPKPILIEKKFGDTSMANILRQVMYLSQLHVGSTNKTRLPITTGYADKICKNRQFIPEGKISNKLFFL